MNKFYQYFKNYSEHINTHYRIGMRVIKTSVAVMFCLGLSALLGSDSIMQISAISAIVTLRASHQDTIHTGAFRLLGTVLGGVFGMLTVLIGLFLPFYSNGLFILVIPIMLVLTLFVCNFFKMQDSCSISCVVLILVASQISLDASVSEALLYTAFRIRDTFIGVIVSSILDALPVWRFFVHHDNDASQ